jgi:hypothetical protein
MALKPNPFQAVILDWTSPFLWSFAAIFLYLLFFFPSRCLLLPHISPRIFYRTVIAFCSFAIKNHISSACMRPFPALQEWLHLLVTKRSIYDPVEVIDIPRIECYLFDYWFLACPLRLCRDQSAFDLNNSMVPRFYVTEFSAFLSTFAI